jgi:predicted porin
VVQISGVQRSYSFHLESTAGPHGPARRAGKRGLGRLTPGIRSGLRKMSVTALTSLGALVGASQMAMAQMTTEQALLPDARSNPVVPTPGQVIVRLGGHINFYAMAVSDSGDKGVGFKQDQYTFADYVHLNPSVDGIAANGLKYGAFVDIWQERNSAPGGGTGGSISAADRVRGNLYVRREWAYLGTDALGTVRMGSGDPVAGLYQTGTFENFNDGGWNGDVENEISVNAAPTWPFALVGNLYTPTTITYLSPQFHGFEVGASFQPNTGNVSDFDGSCSTAGTGCDRLSASSDPADLARRKDMINIEMRYRASLGAVGVATELGWVGSEHVHNDGVPVASAVKFTGFNQGIFGLALTYGGVTVGGHLMAGRFNGQWGLAPANGPSAFAWLGGASYTFGPMIVGGSFFQYNSAGNSFQNLGPNVGQLRERGVALGGTYSLTPGVSLLLSVLYGDRKESGYDLLDQEAGNIHNVVTARLISLGTQIRW